MRVKTGAVRRRRHKKVIKAANGHRGRRNNCFKLAKDAVEKGLQYSYRDRRTKKREFRRLWIVRINAAARQSGLSYSRLMHGLKLAGVDIDRKVLADIAMHDTEAFQAIAETAKSASK